MTGTRLHAFTRNRRCTMLGVGPISKNCVDATIELANEHQVPIFLIASRRQIEGAALGGGYVENWTTERFVEYVRARDVGRWVILARDHGGPWQHPAEGILDLAGAMRAAKDSLAVDINAGMQMIHLDSSIDVTAQPTTDQCLERLFELYEFCHQTASRLGRHLVYEVGTDPQDVEIADLEAFELLLQRIIDYCARHHLPKPAFAVAQTGTKVMETRNIGALATSVRIAPPEASVVQLSKLVAICERHGVWLKEHNADYLPDALLRLHPILGIHAANVAPEFGVAETRALLKLLRHPALNGEIDDFSQLALDSGKWEKWMLPDSRATDQDRVEIAGHYVFANPRFQAIKAHAQTTLANHGIDLGAVLKAAAKQSVLRYLTHFNLIQSS